MNVGVASIRSLFSPEDVHRHPFCAFQKLFLHYIGETVGFTKHLCGLIALRYWVAPGINIKLYL